MKDYEAPYVVIYPIPALDTEGQGGWGIDLHNDEGEMVDTIWGDQIELYNAPNGLCLRPVEEGENYQHIDLDEEDCGPIAIRVKTVMEVKCLGLEMKKSREEALKKREAREKL